jgi:hypothetical protein
MAIRETHIGSDFSVAGRRISWTMHYAIHKENTLITTLVQFPLAEAVSLEQARELFLSTAPKYTKVPGLLRKHYLVAEDGRSAGGAYLWKSRADAEKLFTEEWKEFIVGKYGSQPTIIWLNTPVVVDNGVGAIITDLE